MKYGTNFTRYFSFSAWKGKAGRAYRGYSVRTVVHTHTRGDWYFRYNRYPAEYDTESCEYRFHSAESRRWNTGDIPNWYLTSTYRPAKRAFNFRIAGRLQLASEAVRRLKAFKQRDAHARYNDTAAPANS